MVTIGTSDGKAGLLTRAIEAPLREVIGGAEPERGWLFNPADPGLLKSLDRLSADEASHAVSADASTIAAHTEHLRFSLNLLNRAADGEDPFEAADWEAAWRIRVVSDADWQRLRDALRREAHTWQHRFPRLLMRDETALIGVLAAIPHLAYHLGAIRQIARSIRNPIPYE